MALKSFISTLLVSVFLLCGTAFAEKTYINGIDANYPPFAFIDNSGKPSGFDVEAMDWIAKKMNFTIKHQPMDWDGIIPSLLAKKIDMVCSGMSISPEREKVVTFSEPYWTIHKFLIVQGDSDLTEDNLLKSKKTLGVQAGTNEAEFLQQSAEKNKWNYILKFYESAPLAIEDLLNGRIDGAAVDSPPLEEALKAKKSLKIIGEFAEPDNFGVAVRKDNKELLDIINEGYALLKKDPFWEKLQAKYIKK